MTFGQSLFTHWYYHVPNLALLALSYLLAARLVATLVLRRDSANPVMRLLTATTNPVLKPVATITPRLVPAALVIALAIMWLLALRMALFVSVSATGARL